MADIDTGGRIRTTSPSGAVPSGIIVAWVRSATPPAGWVHCNGSNGTDDLRGRFLRGVPAAGVVGAIGGTTTHLHVGGAHTHGSGTLSAAAHGHAHTLKVPAHNHTATVTLCPCTCVVGCGIDVTVLKSVSVYSVTINTCPETNVTGTITDAGALAVTGSTGSAGAVNTTSSAHLPPYEDVLWIMKV